MKTPDNFKEITDDVDGVFVSADEVVITGTPDEDDEMHNCDAMGCSSLSHVIFRFKTN